MARESVRIISMVRINHQDNGCAIAVNYLPVMCCQKATWVSWRNSLAATCGRQAQRAIGRLGMNGRPFAAKLGSASVARDLLPTALEVMATLAQQAAQEVHSPFDTSPIKLECSRKLTPNARQAGWSIYTDSQPHALLGIARATVSGSWEGTAQTRKPGASIPPLPAGSAPTRTDTPSLRERS